jgi:nickel/cobalt exporter
MREALLYLVSSFWLGAVHAATPGHGKTIAAAYIVGARGRPIDALILGTFVTLSHTSGIVLVAILASLGLPGLLPQYVEAYLALLTGLLVVGIGLWMLVQAHTPGPVPVPHWHSHEAEAGFHRHGWGAGHTHEVAGLTQQRPELLVLLGLGIAGGLLPDPAALAILLSALTRGKLMLGLGMALVFSVGFASTLVVVGVVAAKVGQVVLAWLSGPWAVRLQKGTALLILAVGLVLTAIAWRTISALP